MERCRGPGFIFPVWVKRFPGAARSWGSGFLTRARGGRAGAAAGAEDKSQPAGCAQPPGEAPATLTNNMETNLE